jgi:hypothetical protein
VLRKISQAPKVNITCFHLFAESRPEMIRITVVMGDEYRRRTVWEGSEDRGEGEEKVLGGEVD